MIEPFWCMLTQVVLDKRKRLLKGVCQSVPALQLPDTVRPAVQSVHVVFRLLLKGPCDVLAILGVLVPCFQFFQFYT